MFAEGVLLTCFFLMNDFLITIMVIHIFPVYLKIQSLSYNKYNLNVFFFLFHRPLYYIERGQTQLGH